ncbi:MAG: hypothetical protein E6X72_00225 [Clostridioides difficile]|uniref:hypothetical protein n=1 Tax=Clostridium butyricum TaxID=1492 RepID=UPI0002CC2072|nr:hypothetical protein [Clostridium butyricum]EMU52299.1 hypothetical protein CBDKU1_37310 [Clostridium butyricum DKU-01]MDU4852806.1 hypothetical protein [Clostridioides difficile]
MDNSACNLSKQLETVLAENVRLKQENSELKEHIKIQKNWAGIREGYLLPKLKEQFGNGRCLHSTVATQIGNIVKENLGIARLAEINESNYESAKELAIALNETFCKFEWPHIKKMQSQWKGSY